MSDTPYIHPAASPIRLAGTNGQTVVLVHSFTGSPSRFAGLAARLHSDGYSVHAPLLTGHGTTISDLEGRGVADWIEDVQEAIPRDMPFHLVGFAMGGLLCLDRGVANSAASLTLINVPLRFRSRRPYLAPLAKYVRRFHYWEGAEESNEDGDVFQYNGYPMASLAEFVKLARTTARRAGPTSRPTLIIQATDDPDTDPESARMLAAKLGATHVAVEWIESDQHELLGSPASAAVEELISRHIASA